MDFELSEIEEALGESVRSICADMFPIEELQRVAWEQFAEGTRAASFDHRGWTSLAEAGVFSLQVPQDAGGVDLGMGASAVVFEELGRALVPGPLVATHLAARELPRVAQGSEHGKRLVGVLSRDRAVGVESRLLPMLVAHLGVLDVLVIVDGDGLAILDPTKIEGARRITRTLDPLTPMWCVDALPDAQIVAGADAARRWRRDECILNSALLVGIAGRCVEMAVSHAKEREQFGRPIGSFQAIKHICADMLVRAETSRVAVQAAAVSVDQPEVADSERAAAAAGLLAAEAASRNAKDCIQVHGGMGFTWEVPLHLYLMRARVLGEALGRRGELAELIAERY